MDEDYYPQTDETAAEPAPDQAKTDEGMDSSGLLPKSFFAGDVKPGDRCTIEVARCHNDECEVKYVAQEGEEDESEAEPEPDSMDGSQAALAAMAT